jgi:hypothetical protein
MKINKGKQFAQIIHRKETPDAIKNMLLHLFTDAQNSSQINDRHPDFLEGTYKVLAKDHEGNLNNDFESLARAIEIELGERPLKTESEYKKFMNIVKKWEPIYYINPKLLGARIQIAVDNEKTSDGLVDVLERQVNRLAEWAGLSWTAIETIEQYFPIVVSELIKKNGAKKTAHELIFFEHLLEGQNGFTWRQYEERKLKQLYDNEFWMKAALLIKSNKTPAKAEILFSHLIELYPDALDEKTIVRITEMTGIKPLCKEPLEFESLCPRNDAQTAIVEENPLDLSEVETPGEGDCVDLAKSLSEVLRHPKCPDKLHEVITDEIGIFEQPKDFFSSPEYLARVLCANDEVSE